MDDLNPTQAALPRRALSRLRTWQRWVVLVLLSLLFVVLISGWLMWTKVGIGA